MVRPVLEPSDVVKVEFDVQLLAVISEILYDIFR